MAKGELGRINRRLDDLARALCKELAGHKCDRCGGSPVDWAHIERCGKHYIRWSMNNCLAMCRPCHQWFDSSALIKTEYVKYKHPDKYAWLKEEVDGVPRAQALFVKNKRQDRLDMEADLKRRLAEAKGLG